MQVRCVTKGFADPYLMNLSRQAAKAQDCSAVGRMRPNTRCDKELQAVGKALLQGLQSSADFFRSAQSRPAAL